MQERTNVDELQEWMKWEGSIEIHLFYTKERHKRGEAHGSKITSHGDNGQRKTHYKLKNQ